MLNMVRCKWQRKYIERFSFAKFLQGVEMYEHHYYRTQIQSQGQLP